jgi:hypothetical protein
MAVIADEDAVRSAVLDYLHLIDRPDRWKIANAAWRLR